ncbi:MAG: hypothetical protein ABIO70_25010 [Pseudomonadota bacterium]
MTPYRHIAEVTRSVHDALVSWARDALRQADLETVEVYGQFPPEGTVARHVVLFPYWVGPAPKLVETGRPVSLISPSRSQAEGQSPFIPAVWREFAQALQPLLERWFSALISGPHPRAPVPPRLDDLPAPLAAWYRAQAEAKDGGVWLGEVDGEVVARPPALGWTPGVVITVRYLAVASDPGRGTSEQTSVHAPLSLPALTVLAAGLHANPQLRAPVKAPPLPGALRAFIDAAIASLQGQEQERFEALCTPLWSDERMPFELSPIHDLSNQEFALLMQALQRPLQAALNFQTKLVLGARVEFEPSVAVRARTWKAAREPGGLLALSHDTKDRT